MGLDTHAVLPTLTKDEGGADTYPDAPDEPFEGIFLCGGFNSGGHSSSSFRGKVYASDIERATGVSLYQELIRPDVVARMADSLAESPLTVHIEGGDELINFFHVCKEHGYGLRGWW